MTSTFMSRTRHPLLCLMLKVLASRRLRRWLWIALAIGCALCAAVWYVGFWPLRDPHPVVRIPRGALAVRGVKIYPSPDDPPLENGTVLMRDGVIAAAGRDVPIPAEARVLSCDGCTVTAGFWNAHVHFTEPKWTFAAWKSARTLNAQLADMLTSRGFTTVVDASSDLRITLSLRRRISSGELRGPTIYTAGPGFYPPHGIPYYVKNTVPFFIRWLLPQPDSPAKAAALENQNIARSADLLKLFTGSYIAPGKILAMPLPIAKAAARVAQAHGQLVYSHPSNLAGTLVAIHSGVDVLAHAPDSPDGIDKSLLRAMVDLRMAMIPTLKMFATTVTRNPAYLQPIYSEVRGFHALGGQLLFGTDVGYMTDYNTGDEFQALRQCGLDFHDVLRMLTTAPSERFGVASRRGVIAVGKAADLVLLDADPADDIAAFTKVHWTVRNGQILFARR